MVSILPVCGLWELETSKLLHKFQVNLIKHYYATIFQLIDLREYDQHAVYQYPY